MPPFFDCHAMPALCICGEFGCGAKCAQNQSPMDRCMHNMCETLCKRDPFPDYSPEQVYSAYFKYYLRAAQTMVKSHRDPRDDGSEIELRQEGVLDEVGEKRSAANASV